METIFILLSVLLGSCTTSKVDGITSKVSIINKVDPHSIKADDGRFYAIKIDLINGTDSTLNFWTMSCSWQINWIPDEKALRFFIHCLKNTPEMVQLRPNRKLTYDGIIELVDTVYFDRSKNLRLGFVLINKNEVHGDWEFDDVLNGKVDSGKDIYWSEPFKIDK